MHFPSNTVDAALTLRNTSNIGEEFYVRCITIEHVREIRVPSLLMATILGALVAHQGRAKHLVGTTLLRDHLLSPRPTRLNPATIPRTMSFVANDWTAWSGRRPAHVCAVQPSF